MNTILVVLVGPASSSSTNNISPNMDDSNGVVNWVESLSPSTTTSNGNFYPLASYWCCV